MKKVGDIIKILCCLTILALIPVIFALFGIGGHKDSTQRTDVQVGNMNQVEES